MRLDAPAPVGGQNPAASRWKLHPDYQANFCKGFDGLWLEQAGVDAAQFIEVVRQSITDGEVCDWVLKNVKKPDSVKAAHRERMLNYPKADDAQMQARLKMRKEQAGLAERRDIQIFVDFIDADEKRITDCGTTEIG